MRRANWCHSSSPHRSDIHIFHTLCKMSSICYLWSSFMLPASWLLSIRKFSSDIYLIAHTLVWIATGTLLTMTQPLHSHCDMNMPAIGIQYEGGMIRLHAISLYIYIVQLTCCRDRSKSIANLRKKKDNVLSDLRMLHRESEPQL